MTRRARALAQGIAALLGCAAISNSQAIVTASASFTNFRVTVIDLDLNDGVAASFSSQLGDSRVSTVAHDHPVQPGGPRTVVSDEQLILDRDLQYHSLSRNGVVVSELTGGPGFALSGSASSSGSPTSHTFFTANGHLTDDLVVIQPNTKVIFQADVSVAAAGGSLYNSANPRASFQLMAGPALEGSEHDFEVEVQVGGFWIPERSIAEQMNLSFSTGAEPAFGSMIARVHLHGIVGAIPEPETYAMMLAGLAMLAVIGRRRSLKRA